MTAGAVLLTIFAPFIALVVALVMRGSETNPVKQAFLKSWAWAAGALVVAYFVIGLILVSAVMSAGSHVDSSGPCQGGPVLGAPGESLGNHRYRFPCVGGGSTVVRLP